MSSTGCQQQKSGDIERTHWNSHHQANASSTDVSARHNSYSGTSVNENLVPQTDTGQQRDLLNGKVSSNNIETGLQQSLNRDFSRLTSSAALHGNSLEYAAQTFPSQFQLLQASLTGNASDDLKALFHNQPSRSEETNVRIEVSKLSSTDQEQALPPPLSRQSLTYKAMPVEETGLLTDAQIHDFIAKKVAYFKSILSGKNYGHRCSKNGCGLCTTGRDSIPEADSVIPKSSNVASCPSTSGSNKKEGQIDRSAVIEQSIPAAGQAVEVDSTANAELISKSDTEGCPTSENNLKEYPQIMEKVVATCARNQEESPVLIPKSLDGLTEKYPNLHSMLNFTSSQGKSASPWFNKDNVLGNVPCASDVSEELKIESSSLDIQTCCGVVTEEVTAHSEINSSVDESQIHNVVSTPTNQRDWWCNQKICEGIREGVDCVYSKTGASIAPVSNIKEQAPGNKCYKAPKCLKVPQFEDISDCEDMSPLPLELPSTEHNTVNCPVWCEDPQDGKNSENENPQIENIALERPGEVSERDDKQSSFENESYGHVRGHGQRKTDDSDEELIPNQQILLATETLNKTQDCLSTQRKDYKNQDKTHEHLNDIWQVMPISISDLRFVSEEDQDCPESFLFDDGESDLTDTQCNTSSAHFELNLPAPKLVQASASIQLPVFDTVESFYKTVRMSGFQMLSDSEEEPSTAQVRPELSFVPDDSCETEDSCDYSSSSEYNRLTVSKQLLNGSASPETVDSVSEEGENDEVSNMPKGQTSSVDKNVMQELDQQFGNESYEHHVQPKTNRRNISQKNDIIIIDSDTDDESDQNCENKAKRTGSLSSRMHDSGDVSCTQQMRHLPQTVNSQSGKRKEKLKNRLPPADSPPQHYHGMQFEVMEDTDSDEPHTGESCKTIKTNANGQHNRQTISKTENVIILDSDTEDDSDYYNGAERRRLSSTESEDSGVAERHSPETVDRLCGTPVKSKTQLSPEDSHKRPLSVDKEGDPSLGPNSVRVHTRDDYETQALKTRKETSKKNACVNTSKKESANGIHNLTKNKVQTNAAKPRKVSSHSSPSQESTSSSINSLSSTSGHFSETRQSSAFSRSTSLYGETSMSCIHPKSKQSASNTGQRLSSSKFLMHRSVSHPSTVDHPNPHTKSQSSSRETKAKLTRNWKKDFYPTRFDKKSNPEVGEDFRPSNHNLSREAGPGSYHVERVPRQRHSTHKSTTPLMKKSMSSAIQWSKAINRETPKTKCPVGEGYKWSQKSTVAKPSKDSG